MLKIHFLELDLIQQKRCKLYLTCTEKKQNEIPFPFLIYFNLLESSEFLRAKKYFFFKNRIGTKQYHNSSPPLINFQSYKFVSKFSFALPFFIHMLLRIIVKLLFSSGWFGSRDSRSEANTSFIILYKLTHSMDKSVVVCKILELGENLQKCPNL